MYTLITVLIFIVCILLVLIVLVQNSKGGGLASNFQASTQVAGVRKTADFLEKTTWALAVALLVLAVMGSAFIPRGEAGVDRSMVQEQIQVLFLEQQNLEFFQFQTKHMTHSEFIVVEIIGIG